MRKGLLRLFYIFNGSAKYADYIKTSLIFH